MDILPLAGPDTERFAEKLSELGEMSQFDQTHGFHIDGADENTAVLPSGWQNRLVRVGVYSVLLGHEVKGLCLDPHDLCVAKVIAHRGKDRSFVDALILEGLVDAELLLERLSETVPHDGQSLDYAYAWLLERVSAPEAPR